MACPAPFCTDSESLICRFVLSWNSFLLQDIGAAREWVSRITSRGGTDILAPCQKAVEMLRGREVRCSMWGATGECW
jgi:hypothetical protein